MLRLLLTRPPSAIRHPPSSILHLRSVVYMFTIHPQGVLFWLAALLCFLAFLCFILHSFPSIFYPLPPPPIHSTFNCINKQIQKIAINQTKSFLQSPVNRSELKVVYGLLKGHTDIEL